MNFFNIIEVDQVKEMLKNLYEKKELQSIRLHIDAACDKITSQDVKASFNIPEFNRSTVDGYAINSRDSHGATESIPSMLKLVGESLMGEINTTILKEKEAVYVPTGGMVPEGATAMVMIEYAEVIDQSTLLIYRPVSEGENIIYKGDDTKEGTIIIPKKHQLSAFDIGSLSALGIREVEVYDRLKVSIISTGDEIIDIKEERNLGKVYDINGYVMKAMLEKLSCEVVMHTLVKDDANLLEAKVEESLTISDLVLISGGSSVGTKDYTKAIIEKLSGQKVMVHGIAMKPGKPTILGHVNDKVIFGLPGHPVSATMVFIILVKAYIQGVYEQHLLNKPASFFKQDYVMATLVENVHGAPGRASYQMVELVKEQGRYKAKPIHGKSGLMSWLTKSNGYIIIATDQEGLDQEQEVKVYTYDI